MLKSVGINNSFSHVREFVENAMNSEQSVLHIATYAGCASTWKFTETRCLSYFNCSDYSEMHKNL